ncbi:MAG: oligosaccharide flippase family protein [Erysipelotrichaceae bacterium]|nr:oligosaccharide flippase family protein [Erysipelotrichaceae bacterium]
MKNSNFAIIWKFAEKFALTFFSFVCSMILARLLSPEAYGKYAIVSSIVLVLSTFVTNNIINLIVKDKTFDEVKLNTVFYYNLTLSLLLMLGICTVGLFLHNNLLLLQSINIVIMAVQSVFMALLVKQMMFKKIAMAALFSGLSSFAIAILMAYYGFDVYALIGQYTINNLLLALSLGIISKPKLTFNLDLNYMRANIGFVFSVVIAEVIQLLSRTIQNFIVQFSNSTSVLGYYDKGYTLSRTCSDMFYETANSVTLPLLAKNQDDHDKLSDIIGSVLYIYTLLCMPIIVGFMLFGKEIIVLLFSKAWIDTAYYFQMFFAIYCVISLNIVASQILVIKNHYKVYRNLTVIFNVLALLVMVICYKLGAIYMPLIMLVFAMINFIVSLYYIKKLINYGLKDYMLSCKGIYTFGIIMMLIYMLNGQLDIVGKIVLMLGYIVIFGIYLWLFDRKRLFKAYQQLLKK